MKVFGKIMLIVGAALLIALAAFVLFALVSTANVKLEPEKLHTESAQVQLLAGDGEKIASPKQYAELETLPSHLPAAFVAVEDKRFYAHGGLDVLRIGKAALKNIASFSFREGASTISQQLIKNTHLSGEKTIRRKLKEWKLTFELEKSYSKEQILELYLNSIYFGHSAFGVGSAAQYYFGKDAGELVPAESAMLAALVRSPNRYSPFRDEAACKERRDLVLDLMEEQGILSAQEAKEAKETPLPQTPHENKTSGYVRLVFEELSEVFPELDSEDKLVVETYFDRALQEKMEAYPAECGCTLIAAENEGHALIAYHTTAGEIRRSPASLIKPLGVYAPALEEGLLSPATPLLDDPVSYGGYSPKNYDGKCSGYVSAREALARSLNIPAVKVMNSVTPKKSAQYLREMALPVYAEDETLALALGGMREGFTMRELASAFLTLSDGGLFAPAKCIRRVTDESGKVLYERAEEKRRVFSEETSYLLSDMLHTAATEGTAKKLRTLPYFVSAKTGTGGTEKGNTDAYAMGYTSEHTIGVWLGNGDNSPISATGGGEPANELYALFKALYRERTPEAFVRPEGVVEAALDREEYENRHRLVLADPAAPAALTKKELFSAAHLPQAVSDRFSMPRIETPHIFVKNGVVCIRLCLTQYYDYEVKREGGGENKVIYRGKWRETVCDGSVRAGVRYTYTVTPFYGEKAGESAVLPSVRLDEGQLPEDWWE